MANSKGLFFVISIHPWYLGSLGRALLLAGTPGPGRFYSLAPPSLVASAPSTASSASGQHIQGCRARSRRGIYASCPQSIGQNSVMWLHLIAERPRNFVWLCPGRRVFKSHMYKSSHGGIVSCGIN